MTKRQSSSTGKRLVFNAACNWLAFALHVVIVFFLTPFIISRIGAAGYGIWAIANGLTGYFGLVDFGLRAGLTQLVTHMVADRQQSQLAATISGAWCALGALALMIFVVVVPIIVYAGPTWFRLDEAWAGQFRWSMVVLGLVFCIQLVLFPYGTVLPALQRYDLSALISAVTRLVSLVANIVVLTWWPTLVALSSVFAGTTICEYVARAFAAKMLLPEFGFTMHWNSKAIRTVLSYTLWNAIITLAGRIHLYTGVLVLGLIRNPLDVAAFAVASRLVEYVARSMGALTSVMFPAMAHAAAQMTNAQLARLLFATTRLVTLVVATVAIGGCFLGSDFLWLWLGGETRRQGLDLTKTASILHILLVGLALTAPRHVTVQFLTAVKCLRVLALVAIAEAIVHIVLAMILAYSMGALGVAYSNAMPGLLVGVWVEQYCVLKYLDAKTITWFKNIWLPTGMLCLVLAPVSYFFLSVRTISGWGDLLMHGSVFAILAAFLVCLFGFQGRDRACVGQLVSGAWSTLRKTGRARRSGKPDKMAVAAEREAQSDQQRAAVFTAVNNGQ